MWRLCREIGGRRGYSVQAARQLQSEWRVGQDVGGFKVCVVESIPEFDLTAIRLEHSGTKADYLHIARKDSNNVFCVGFRTTPEDSTGLPHILEHVTLCGSHKYPCRDPFFKMLNRSMATFMNAMTGPDYTIYPFSTENPQDYRNLMSVYLDAVFRPNLRESDFRQEGWRLENSHLDDPKSPLVIKGVVFNEMKGAFSDNQSILGEALLNGLLPSHTYGVVSGGDPLLIPSLTYQELKDFHLKFYNPSNARFFSYGDMPLHAHLEFIHSEYLSKWTSGGNKSECVPSEKRWSKERRKHVGCRHDPLAGDPNKQSMISIGTLCNDIKETEETFTLQVLSELLVRGPNSSFYKSMVEPNIGAGFNSTTGYDSQTRDTSFTVGLQGLDPKQFDNVVEIYHKTVEKAIEEGFEDKNIQGILHNIELNIKHQTPKFGLGLLFGLNPVWNHEGDILAPLRVNHQVSSFKKALRDKPTFLQDTVKKYLKDNSHRLILTMSPEEGYEERQVEEEKKVLEGKVRGLGKEDFERIWKEGLELRKEQEGRQGGEVLPSLGVEDLRREVERASVVKSRVEGVPVYICTAPTNGVDYLTGVLGCGELAEGERDMLPLLCHVLARMGSRRRDYKELDQAAQLKTGGLSAGMHISDHLEDRGTFEEGLVFSSHSLERNTLHMVDLWTEVLTEADFRNVKRFETLLKVLASDLSCGIAGSGHLYAMSSAGALVSPSALRSDRYGGLSFVTKVQELARRKDMGELLAEVEEVRGKVVNKTRLRVALNTRRRAGEESVLERLLGSLGGEGGEGGPLFRKEILQAPHHSPHHIINIPVSYAALALPTVTYLHPSFPALRVLARLLTSQYLLPQIREKGGAYGAGAKLSSDGLFSFYSYRDPSPQDSYSVFEAASEWVRRGSFQQREVDEAKLGVFQSLDAPQAPSSLGLRHFLYSLSDDVFQSHRLALMKLNKDDIISAAQLLDSPVRARALLGPENPKLPSHYNWKQIKSE